MAKTTNIGQQLGAAEYFAVQATKMSAKQRLAGICGVFNWKQPTRQIHTTRGANAGQGSGTGSGNLRERILPLIQQSPGISAQEIANQLGGGTPAVAVQASLRGKWFAGHVNNRQGRYYPTTERMRASG